MRFARIATTFSIALLTACGAQDDGQANVAQVNATAQDRAAAANSADLAAMTGAPVTQDQAKAAIHERHEAMEKIGKATKAASRELKSAGPDFAIVRASAATIEENARTVGSQFPKGSGPDAGKTGAKPEIWDNPQDFAAKMEAFHNAAQAFRAAAAGDDLAAIKKGFADLGGTCKACHDKYRQEAKR